MTPEQVARFWAKVDKSGECWIWTGYRDPQGYGVHRGELAHRVSWALEHGPIAPGVKICHNCPAGDNPSCTRPAHLFEGTQADNMADKVRKGRCGTSKVTPADVLSIRARRDADTATEKELAQEYNVHYTTIRQIAARKTWWHI
jgi:hypothetical protein